MVSERAVNRILPFAGTNQPLPFTEMSVHTYLPQPPPQNKGTQVLRYDSGEFS